MSMQAIRDRYKVPAKRGMRVTVDGKPGVITGSRNGALHLMVRFDGVEPSVPCHPTWRVKYEPPDPERRPEMSDEYERLHDLIEETLPDAEHDVEMSPADVIATVLWDHGYRLPSAERDAEVAAEALRVAAESPWWNSSGRPMNSSDVREWLRDAGERMKAGLAVGDRATSGDGRG